MLSKHLRAGTRRRIPKGASAPLTLVLYATIALRVVLLLYTVKDNIHPCISHELKYQTPDPAPSRGVAVVGRPQRPDKKKTSGSYCNCKKIPYLSLTSFVTTVQVDPSITATASPGPPHMSSTRPVTSISPSSASMASGDVQYRSKGVRRRCVTGSGTWPKVLCL